MKSRYTNPDYWETAGVAEYIAFGILLCLLCTVAVVYLLVRITAGTGDLASDILAPIWLYFSYLSIRAAIVGALRRDW